MRAQQQNKTGIGVVRRWPVHSVPEGISGARPGGADIGVAVVAVDAPSMQHTLVVKQLVSRPADVIHDFVLAAFLKRFANASAKVVENVVPGDALPFAFAAPAGAL